MIATKEIAKIIETELFGDNNVESLKNESKQDTFLKYIADELDCKKESILNVEMCLADVQPPVYFIF